MNNRISYVHQPLNHYRDHANNTSKNLMRQFSFIEEYFRIYNWAINAITFIKKDVLVNLFKEKTAHSLRGNWNWKRIRLYHRLIWTNPYLFAKLFEDNAHNLISRLEIIRPAKRQINKNKKLQENQTGL